MLSRFLSHLVYIFFLCFELSAGAEQIADKQPSIMSTRPDIRLTLRSSRPVISVNDVTGIFADITNFSQNDIFFKPKNIAMVAPPELDPDSPHLWWASINTAWTENESDNETNFSKKSKEIRLEENDKIFYKISNRVVRIGSGDTATAFWGGVISRDRLEENLENFYRASKFMPGDYLIKVVAIYWLDEKDADKQNVNYFTGNAEMKISVTSPQYIVIIGAIIGGIIAYIALPVVRSGKKGKEHFLGLLTAALLSAIVTVLLSRISETQFFIKVTVNDLWGSIAIGFLANAAGFSIIKKYLPTGTEEPEGGVKPDADALKTAPTDSKEPKGRMTQ
jgi:hypothetical protein